MSVRYLITVDPDADTAAVEAGLKDAGARSVSPPARELPDVFIADVDETDDAFAERARGVAGVTVAERDVWVGFGDEDPGPGPGVGFVEG